MHARAPEQNPNLEALAAALDGWRDTSPRAEAQRARDRARWQRKAVQERRNQQRREAEQRRSERRKAERAAAAEQDRDDLIADVETVIGTDTVASIAARLETTPKTLAKRLRRYGRDDLANRLERVGG